MQASVLLFRWGSYCWACNLLVLIIYLFFLPVMLPSGLPSLTTDSAGRVFPGVWKPLFLRFPSRDGAPSLPLLSLFLSYNFSYLFLKTTSCFSWCLMSSAGIQKLFCGIYSALKCSFDEFLREKVVSLAYSSAIFPSLPSFVVSIIAANSLFWVGQGCLRSNLSADKLACVTGLSILLPLFTTSQP